MIKSQEMLEYLNKAIREYLDLGSNEFSRESILLMSKLRREIHEEDARRIELEEEK